MASIFKIPTLMAKKIDQICKIFIWTGTKDKKRMKYEQLKGGIIHLNINIISSLPPFLFLKPPLALLHAISFSTNIGKRCIAKLGNHREVQGD